MPAPAFALFETAIGRCAIVWSERGIVGVALPEANDQETRARVLARWEGAREGAPRAGAKLAIEAIAGHLGGAARFLGDVALDTTGIPEFHARVYGSLRAVPSGTTVTYGELALRVGVPGAARAVGRAVATNPFPLLVPCHRVLAAGGRPGGFSAPGGTATKARLLAIEGITLKVGPRKTPGRTLDLDEPSAIRHLSSRDGKLAQLIEQVGPLRLELFATRSTFDALAESIVYQQLNGKAAATIHGRLCALFPRGRPLPEPLLALGDAPLRAAGISRGKTLALRDLAARTLDGTVPSVSDLRSMSDDAIVDRLVKVRGIGRWTVEMVLIFRLGRPDVLPVDDYGVRQGFKLAYRKREIPTPRELARHGEKWRPFRTVASWYLWRAVDLARQRLAAGSKA